MAKIISIMYTNGQSDTFEVSSSRNRLTTEIVMEGGVSSIAIVEKGHGVFKRIDTVPRMYIKSIKQY